MLSMALGVTMVVLVLSISWLVTESFDRNSNVGYNLIVGSKGGALQLALNSVFYLSKPIEVIPYEEYLELIPGKEGRRREIERIGGRVAEPERPGLFSAYTSGKGFAIPICLGDYFGPFRVVGTTPDFFDKLRHGPLGEKEYTFAQGRNFVDCSDEHGFFEAVLGAHVARVMNKQVGDILQTTHGDPDGEGHGEEFMIVGILDSTGTPNDRAAFINLEGFYWLDNHAREAPDLSNPDELKVDVAPAGVEGQPARLPLHKRDLTAVLVRTGEPMFAVNLMWTINKRLNTQAVSPLAEIANLLQLFVTPIRNLLLALTILVCIVSAISILVSIYNSMNERRRDIAVMRALGARRDVIMLIVLVEAVLIAVVGGLLGWLLGHAAGLLASDFIEQQTGLQVGMFNTVSWQEAVLIPGLIVLAILAGIIPALRRITRMSPGILPEARSFIDVGPRGTTGGGAGHEPVGSSRPGRDLGCCVALPGSTEPGPARARDPSAAGISISARLVRGGLAAGNTASPMVMVRRPPGGRLVVCLGRRPVAVELSGLRHFPCLAGWVGVVSGILATAVCFALATAPPRRDSLSDLATRKPQPIALRGILRSVPTWTPNPQFRVDQPDTEVWLTWWQVQWQSIRQGNQWHPIVCRSKLTVPGRLTHLLPGDEVQVFGTVRAVPSATNPGGANWSRRSRGQGLFVAVSADATHQIRKLSSGWQYCPCAPRQGHSEVDQNLRDYISSGRAALAAALVSGSGSRSTGRNNSN